MLPKVALYPSRTLELMKKFLLVSNLELPLHILRPFPLFLSKNPPRKLLPRQGLVSEVPKSQIPIGNASHVP